MGRQKLCSNGVAGPRQHSHHAMQVDEDVSHPFQDHLLLHDGLGTEAQGGGPLPGTPPPHTHTYIRSIIRHIFTYLQASLYFLGGWANITFPYGLWDVGS